MNNKLITVGVVAVLILVGTVLVVANNKPQNNEMSSEDHSSAPASKSDKTNAPTETLTTDQVTFKSFDVVEKKIQVKVGTTVTWTNKDSAKHDVTPDNPSEDFKASELFGKGETYQWKFTKAGTYTYFCSPHPYMKGTIEVVE